MVNSFLGNTKKQRNMTTAADWKEVIRINGKHSLVAIINKAVINREDVYSVRVANRVKIHGVNNGEKLNNFSRFYVEDGQLMSQADDYAELIDQVEEYIEKQLDLVD